MIKLSETKPGLKLKFLSENEIIIVGYESSPLLIAKEKNNANW